MSFLKYLFGIQLFLGSLWCFYYSLTLIGDILLGLSALILIPGIYKLLTKKLSGAKAASIIIIALCFILSGLIVHSLLGTQNKKAPAAINKNNPSPIINFEQKTDSDVKIKTYDIIGNNVLNFDNHINAGLNQMKLNIKKLNQGSYLIHILGKDLNMTRKFIKQ